MSYTQLTQTQRYQIYKMKKAGYSQAEMAAELHCHKSTISRELKRNAGTKGYRPLQAHERALSRRCLGHWTRIQQTTWKQIELLLREQWSPVQIHQRLLAEKQPSVSHEWIYQYIYADRLTGGTLYRHLRSQRKHRKRHRRHARRAQIPNRTSIEKRPKIVASKKRIGDWEIDTIVGARHRGGLISCVERKSKLTLLCKIETKGALEVKRKLVELLKPWADQVLTCTVDNGKEFCEHRAIAALLNTRIYFAHPYASWERGLNENTNGLVRQYFAKKTDFSKVTEAEVKCVQAKLNNRPRKTLGFRTPYEVIFKRRLPFFKV